MHGNIYHIKKGQSLLRPFIFDAKAVAITSDWGETEENLIMNSSLLPFILMWNSPSWFSNSFSNMHMFCKASDRKRRESIT